MSGDEGRRMVSDAEVKDFYEKMPYPPPLTTLEEHRELYKNPVRRATQFHLLWPAEPLRENLEILVAGCGTSQAARYALREPNARVTGIDLSETSLRYTNALKQNYDLKNLELHQLPVERVGELGRTFDLIVCTGVLHHLPDPNLGLRALRDVLKPTGVVHLMVYAAYGRAGIYMIKEYCRLLGISSSENDLRELGKTLRSLPGDHPFAVAMQGALDFSNPHALADALLHPIDRAYDVPELYELLESCGLSFGRWFEQAPYLAQCGMIAKTPHAERLAALPPRQQHAAIELYRGTMFKHSVLAYRNDRVGASQPITFAGEHWREYIPIAVPWSVCVRERLPKGSVAVLINRAHTFTDLILPLDKNEDRLFGAIDGKRTLGEILKLAGNDIDERQAVTFFERLWRYDQVVFYAPVNSKLC